MCGRFVLNTDSTELSEEFGVKLSPDFRYKSYNIAPSQYLPVIHIDHLNTKQITLMEWGILPLWASNIKAIPRPINARLETIYNNSIFKSSLQKRRCLIPVNGFYEWDSTTNPKQPYYFYEQDRQLFAFAGLWNIWEKEASRLFSFTIITKEAEKTIKPIHGRMPFVLRKQDYESWLLKALLPDKSPPLTCHPISLAVNSPKNNDTTLIRDISQ